MRVLLVAGQSVQRVAVLDCRGRLQRAAREAICLQRKLIKEQIPAEPKAIKTVAGTCAEAM